MKESALLTGIKQLWDGDASLAALVPGGLHQGRVSSAELPAGAVARKTYASMRVTESEPEWTSTTAYLQPFQLAVFVWNAPGAGAVNAGAIMTAMDVAISRDRKSDLQVSGARVVDIRRVPGSLEEDPAVKEASDVYVAGGSWEITLQLLRP